MNEPQVIRVLLASAESDSPSAEALLADFAEALCAYERLYGDGAKKYVCDRAGTAEGAACKPVADPALAVVASPIAAEGSLPRRAILYDPRVDYAALAKSPRLGWLRRPASEAIDGLVLAVRCGTADGQAADVSLDPPRRLVARALACLHRRPKR